MSCLCVFCGMNAKKSIYNALGQSLGKKMTEHSWDLVYGGASLGVMGAVANAVLTNSGKVYGVIPKKLMELEAAHTGLTKLIIVDSLHDRKQKMYDLSHAFVTLPGGFGTLDEFCEILTWVKLHYYQKPIFLLNHQGFFDLLIQHFQYTKREGFISEDDFALVRIINNVDDLFSQLEPFHAKS